MNAFQAMVLGAVQGLTEFLPVSSSGHLLVLEKVFGMSPDLSLNILLHVGTLLAVFVVYWKDIWNMVRHPIQSEFRWLVIATIPAVIAALVIDFDDAFEGKFIVWSFYLTSIVLVAGSAINSWRRRTQTVHHHMRLRDALSMGVMQAIAILPGLSRSGSTIAGGLASGLSRRHAAKFSFLMSIPAILGSAVLDLKDVVMGTETLSFDPLTALIGMVFAALFGLVAIKTFMALVRRVGLNVFAIYTAVVGTVLLLNNYVFHWITF